MATTMKLNGGTMMVTFAEKKGASVQNYQMYTDGIKALCEIGRVATLKVVEAVTRVNNQSLWKLGNSEKTGLPYSSINEWAISEFGYSKSHVSEMLSVAKQCCDPETGIPLETLAGYSYTQLLGFTKNPGLLLKIKAGEEVEGIGLGTSAKNIKDFGKKIEDKSNKDKKSEQNDQGDQFDQNDQSDNVSHESHKSAPHQNRTITIDMDTMLKWYGLIEAGCGCDVIAEWDKILGNPFAKEGK